jgi:aspartyl aminopeptidase
MDEDLNKLIPEDKFLYIGKKKFKIWISAERALKATALFNRISQKGTEEHDRIKTDYDFYNEMLEVAFLLIKQDFKLLNIFDWIRRELLTKKYILKHMDVKELSVFVEDALEPIIGTKKKELERQDKAAEAMMKLMDQITPEQLATLLQNSLQAVDTKKAM